MARKRKARSGKRDRREDVYRKAGRQHRALNKKARLDRRQRRANANDGCTGKKSFADYEKARSTAIKMLEKRADLKKMTIYLCDVCSHYHLSSREYSNAVIVLEKEE